MNTSINFIIKNKVALVTGGASGIGYCIVTELLKNGAKGVIIADFNKELGAKALSEIQNEFGKEKAVFVKCDVANLEEFENAFRKGVDTFKALDIVVNNAGIANEIDFQKTISTNLVGVINGINLALNTYLPKFKSDNNAVILNIASAIFLSDLGSLPVYAATKSAVVSLTRSWGCQPIFEKTNIRVIAVCPGLTDTAISPQLSDVLQDLWKENNERGPFSYKNRTKQAPEHCAQTVIKTIQTAPSGTIWIVANGEMPFEYKFQPKELFKPSSQ